MIIYWQSIVPQHVSGVFTPIIKRADCVPLRMVSCPGYGCGGSGESGGEMTDVGHHPLHSAAHLATHLSRTTTTHRQWHAVCSPDDGRKDARNMLRNN